MNAKSYANYLLLLLIGLQLLSMIVFLLLYSHIGPKSLILSVLLMGIFNILCITGFDSIVIYDRNGKQVKPKDKLAGNIIAISVWSAIISVILIIVGSLFAYKSSQSYGHHLITSLFVPILSTGTFYISVYLSTFVKK